MISVTTSPPLTDSEASLLSLLLDPSRSVTEALDDLSLSLDRVLAAARSRAVNQAMETLSADPAHRERVAQVRSSLLLLAQMLPEEGDTPEEAADRQRGAPERGAKPARSAFPSASFGSVPRTSAP